MCLQLSLFHFSSQHVQSHAYQLNQLLDHSIDPFRWWSLPDTFFLNPALIYSPHKIIFTYFHHLSKPSQWMKEDDNANEHGGLRLSIQFLENNVVCIVEETWLGYTWKCNFTLIQWSPCTTICRRKWKSTLWALVPRWTMRCLLRALGVVKALGHTRHL